MQETNLQCIEDCFGDATQPMKHVTGTYGQEKTVWVKVDSENSFKSRKECCTMFIILKPSSYAAPTAPSYG